MSFVGASYIFHNPGLLLLETSVSLARQDLLFGVLARRFCF